MAQMSPMAEQAQMLNYLLGNGQGAMYLGPGVTGRMNYADPLIPEKIANTKAGEPILKDNQQVLGNTVIGEEAPMRLWERISTGVQDWWDPSKDRDMRGGVVIDDPLVPESHGMYVKVDPETGYGGQVKLEPVMVDNPEAGKKTNPVPVLDQLGRWTNQFATDAYTGWRDQRRMAGNLGMVGSALKDATYFGHQLDKAQMYDFMNSPLGQARTSLTAQQAQAVPRLAKAALIEAIAKRQGAANEFGQLGTQRTYFTG